jgi:hypothetical protein
MNYIIIALKDNKELLGTDNATLVHNCKSMVKVNNALKSFNPSKQADKIKVYSYSNLYDEKTYKLYKEILINKQ